MSGVPLVVFGLYNILLALTRVNWHRSNSEGKAEHNQMQETNQIQKRHAYTKNDTFMSFGSISILYVNKSVLIMLIALCS